MFKFTNPFTHASEATKKKTVEAIEKANGREYQHQVASYYLIEKVIEDMLKDPFWVEIIETAIKSRNNKSASPAHDGQN